MAPVNLSRGPGKAGLQGLSLSPSQRPALWDASGPSQREAQPRDGGPLSEHLPQHIPILAAGRVRSSHISKPTRGLFWKCPAQPPSARESRSLPLPWQVPEAPERRQRLPAETSSRCQGAREGNACLPAPTEAGGQKSTRLLQRPGLRSSRQGHGRHVLYSRLPNPDTGDQTRRTLRLGKGSLPSVLPPLSHRSLAGSTTS